jgi:hypothetical protein
MITGFIYKIYDNTNANVYYGSTINKICKRMTGHRNNYKAWIGGNGNNCNSYDILKNGDYSYSLVEKVECENKMELHKRERWYIENNECVNKRVPNRSREEYYQANREQICERQREYDQKNTEQKKEHYQANRERILEQHRQRYQQNKVRLGNEI